jgi:hypothetical protein
VWACRASIAGRKRRRVCHHQQGVGSAAQVFELVVHPLHEPVEVHAHAPVRRQALEKQIHQHGLAPTHPAPQIKSLHRVRPFARKATQQISAPAVAAFENLKESFQQVHHPSLGRIFKKLRVGQ